MSKILANEENLCYLKRELHKRTKIYNIKAYFLDLKIKAQFKGTFLNLKQKYMLKNSRLVYFCSY